MGKLFKIIIFGQCLITVIFLVTPIISLFLKIQPTAFFATLMSEEILAPLILSITTSAISTFIAVLLGIAISYVLVFKKLPFNKILNTVVTLPMVLPPSVAGYILLITFGRYGTIGHFINEFLGIQIMFTKTAIIIAQVFVILPFVINSLRTSFEDIDPNYSKVAYVLGASEWYMFKNVILPLSQSGLFTGIILAFARAMGEFGATMLVSGLNETMTIAIYKNAMSGNRLEADVLSVILIIVSFSILLMSSLAHTKRLLHIKGEDKDEKG